METIKANFRDGVIEDGYMWVFDNMIQAICKINLESYEMEIVDRYIGENDYIVSWILAYENCFYLMNASSPKMLIYDRGERTFIEKFDFEGFDSEKNQISGAFIYKNSIWMLPLWLSNVICCYDLHTKKYYKKDDLIYRLKSHKENKGVFSGFYHRKDNYLYVTVFGGPAYIEYNLNNGKSQIFELEDNTMQLSGICNVGGDIWITCINTSNIYYLKQDGKCIENICEGMDNRPYTTIVPSGDGIVVLPRYAESGLYVEPSKDKIIDLKMVYTKNKNREGSYLEKARNVCYYQENLFIYPFEAEELYLFMSEDKVVKRIELLFNGNYSTEKIERFILRKQYIRENDYIDISSLIEYEKRV